MPSKSEAIKRFLIASTHDDLSNLYDLSMECQVNVAQDGGERVGGDYKGRKWHGWSDDLTTWKSFRIPYKANTEPEFEDREIKFAGWDAVDPAGFVRGDRKVVYYPSLDRAYAYDLSRDPEEMNPGSVSADETEQIRQALETWRLRSRIAFDAKRYHERSVFSHWQILSQGNTPWCYYLPQRSAAVR